MSHWQAEGCVQKQRAVDAVVGVGAEEAVTPDLFTGRMASAA